LTVYIDTSVLVAYYCPETLSEKVEAFITAQRELAISAITEIEMFSALSRKVREKAMNRLDAGRVTTKFISHVDGQYFTYLPVEAHHFRLARDWIGMFKLNLRTLDALHLAIASSEGFSIVTTDRSLSKSAKGLGLSSILLEQ
jgi:predicted nucleic acid-binding protein